MNIDNVCGPLYCLEKPERFTNTIRVFGSRITLTEPGEHGLLLFSGFVFRGDKRPPDMVFNTGLAPRPRPVNFEEFVNNKLAEGIPPGTTTIENLRKQYDKKYNPARVISEYTGGRTGFTHEFGVSTTICAHVAQQYLIEGRNRTLAKGYVYLIDARSMAGYAIRSPRPTKYPTTTFPALKTIYEVNFTHMIPASFIVGIVWSYGFESTSYRCTTVWSAGIKRLMLGSNPSYSNGLNGTREVVKRFNY